MTRELIIRPYTRISLVEKETKPNNAHGVVSVPDVNKLNQQPIGQISLLAGVDLDAKVSCQKAFILSESPVTRSTTTDRGETHGGCVSGSC